MKSDKRVIRGHGGGGMIRQKIIFNHKNRQKNSHFLYTKLAKIQFFIDPSRKNAKWVIDSIRIFDR
jgi:hypothetical protein